jgi:hypothetical protein
MGQDFAKEEELYEPVRDFLIECGFEVQAEVCHCDVCGRKGDQIVIVELKRGLTIDLLIQATQRQRVADCVYIAFPKPKKMMFSKKWNNILHLIKRLELGLILVSKSRGKTIAEEVVTPQPFDMARSRSAAKRKKTALIRELDNRSSNLNIGGSTRKKIMTAYREQAISIAKCLKTNGTMNTRQFSEYGIDGKRARQIMYDNHYGWFERVDKATYQLTSKGLEELSMIK